MHYQAHLLEHLQLHEGRPAILDGFHVPLSSHLHVRQQVLHAFCHALCMRGAPPLGLLALEDGLQLIVLLFCFVVWARPCPVPFVLALTAQQSLPSEVSSLITHASLGLELPAILQPGCKASRDIYHKDEVIGRGRGPIKKQSKGLVSWSPTSRSRSFILLLSHFVRLLPMPLPFHPHSTA